MEKKTNWPLSAFEPTAVPGCLMTGESKQILNQERWSEDFQDLSVYCNTGSKMADNLVQPLGEQLNTPIITVREEFDFNGGRKPSAGDLYDDVDPWGAQIDNKPNTQTQLWYTVSDWLTASNNQRDINDQEDIVDVGADIDAVDETNFDTVIEDLPHQSQLPHQQHLICSGRDYLLSQSSDYIQGTSPFSEIAKEPSSHLVDLMSHTLLKPEPQFYKKNNVLQPGQLLSVKNINNNNKLINMNNVLISNNNKNKDNRNTLPVKSQHQEQPNLVIVQSRPKSNSAFVSCNQKNRRNQVINATKNLSSIFKSEEPLISESSKQLCNAMDNTNSNDVNNILSINSSANNNYLNVPAVVIASETLATTSTGSNNIKLETSYVNSYSSQVVSSSCRSEYNFDNPVKIEPKDSMDVEVEIINEHRIDPNIQPDVGKPFKSSPQNLKKTGLKLDIDSAARLVTATTTPIITPSTSIAATCDIINTPEVLRPLLSSNGFDLLEYISGEGGGIRDDLNSPSVFAVFDSPVADLKKNVAIIKPVKQFEISEAAVVEKRETTYELPTLSVVKEEKEDDECEESRSTFADESMSFSERPTVKRKVSKRKRIVKKSEDMESDLSNLSDFIDEDDEKHDKTFTLSTPSKRKRTTSSTSRTSTEYSRSTERMSHYSKQRKLSRDTDSSDHDSIASTIDRYRELRDRNNEASRRSRLNRKSREMEMKEEATKMEQENKRLKAKADEMEKLVKRLRESLMQLVLKKR